MGDSLLLSATDGGARRVRRRRAGSRAGGAARWRSPTSRSTTRRRPVVRDVPTTDRRRRVGPGRIGSGCPRWGAGSRFPARGRALRRPERGARHLAQLREVRARPHPTPGDRRGVLLLRPRAARARGLREADVQQHAQRLRLQTARARRRRRVLFPDVLPRPRLSGVAPRGEARRRVPGRARHVRRGRKPADGPRGGRRALRRRRRRRRRRRLRQGALRVRARRRRLPHAARRAPRGAPRFVPLASRRSQETHRVVH